MGLSIEGNVGAVRLEPNDGGATETSMTAGLAVAIEFDWLRDANLGVGFGWQTIRAGGDSDDPGAGVSATPMRIWFASAMRSPSWRFRPRVTMGMSLANGEGDLYADGYAGIGGSWHPARGTAVHLMIGPQLVRAADERVLSPRAVYQGWGAQARIRLFRMFRRRCDPATFEEAEQRVSTRQEGSCL